MNSLKGTAWESAPSSNPAAHHLDMNFVNAGKGGGKLLTAATLLAAVALAIAGAQHSEKVKSEKKDSRPETNQIKI